MVKPIQKHALLLAGLGTVLPCFGSQLTDSVSISFSRAPGAPNEFVYGRINGADDNDPTLNPCWGMMGCAIRAWVVSREWPNRYQRGYMTYDISYGTLDGRREACGYGGRTVGDVVACLRKAGILHLEMLDFLPGGHGDRPEMCLFLNEGTRMASGASRGPLGPCAIAYVPSKCSYIGSLDVRVKGSPNRINNGTPYPAAGSGAISCNNDIAGTLRVTTSNGRVTLDNGGECAVDFGAGPGVALKLRVSGGKPYAITASCTFSGVVSPGVHRGSAVVLFSLD